MNNEWIECNLPYLADNREYSKKSSEFLSQWNEQFLNTLWQRSKAAGFSEQIPASLFSPMHEWFNSQPEVIERDLALKRLYEERSKGFCDTEFNKPGVLIELRDGTQYLIGDIDTNGGGSDGYAGLSMKDFVVKYKVVWEKEENENCNSYIGRSLFPNII